MPEEPFGEGHDFSLVFPGALEGGLPGHIRFYLGERIPNPEKRRFLLNAIYVLAWHELVELFPRRRWFSAPELPDNADNIYDNLTASLDMVRRSSNRELHRWANSLEFVLYWKKCPRYGFWCRWGWSWQWPLTYILPP